MYIICYKNNKIKYTGHSHQQHNQTLMCKVNSSEKDH